MPRLRYLPALAALLAGCCAVTAGHLTAASASVSATAAKAWGVAERIPSLDAIAAALGSSGVDGNPGGGIGLNSLSCPKPGYCTAVGALSSGSDNEGSEQEGWVATESAGVWTAPKVVKIGGGGFPSYVVVSAVSCASPGNCAAVGYDSQAVEGTGFVDTYGVFDINEVNGTWSAPRQIPGTDTLNQGNYARTSSVSCSAPGDCAVAGTVNGASEFVDTETGGTWGTARLLPGFTAAPGSIEGGWPSVSPVISCPQAGDCTVAGSDSGPSGAVTSVATETGGTWGDAGPLPGFAATGGAVTSLSCPAVGDCSAGGWATSGKQQVPFVAGESGGTWTSSAVGVASPGPVTLDPGSVTALSCASPGNCSAGGSYRPSPPEVNVFLVSEVGGTWQVAKPVAGLVKTEQGIGVSQISCPAAGYCAAVISRAGVGYVAQQSAGTWATARLVAGVTGSGGASTVSCPVAGVCEAGGVDHKGTEAWVLTRSALTTTLTTASPSAAKVTYGNETAEKITVTVTATTPAPAGQVTVTANGKTLCTIALKNGAGRCPLTARQLKEGTYRVVARYHGAAPYAASSSAAKTFKVVR